MSQKNSILRLLSGGKAMTQGDLAEKIYGDRSHTPNIYSTLQALVCNGCISRQGSRPAYYSLTGESIQKQEEMPSPIFRQPNKISDKAIDSVICAAKKYYQYTHDDENGRYRSWEHCYSEFAKARRTQSEEYDRLSLHLAFYLASWGMYRGSSFLLQKDYRIHIPAVKMILDPKFDVLLGMDCSELKDRSNQKLIEELGIAMGEYYNSIRKSIETKQNTKHEISTILITKILLGTLGCVPAYDQFFVKGIRKLHIASGTYQMKSLLQLADFYDKNAKSLEDCRAELRIADSNLQYPQMKLLDMGFWQIGIDD